MLQSELMRSVEAGLGSSNVDVMTVETAHDRCGSGGPFFNDCCSTLETTIGGESLVLCMLAEDSGGGGVAEWCRKHMCAGCSLPAVARRRLARELARALPSSSPLSDRPLTFLPRLLMQPAALRAVRTRRHKWHLAAEGRT